MKLTLLAFLIGFGINSVQAQLDHSIIFLNLKRSIPSNFISGEFQIGNKDSRHYVSVSPGINFSNFTGNQLSAYYTGNVITDYNYSFTKYRSKKIGVNISASYFHYFKNMENEKELIPLIATELSWFRIRDNHSLTYTENNIGTEYIENRNHSFQTLSANIQFGFMYAFENFYLRTTLVAEYFLPVDDSYYMPTDHFNRYNGKKLPFNGIEPSLQLSLGFKLF